MKETECVFKSENGSIWYDIETGNFGSMNAGHSLCRDMADEIMSLRSRLTAELADRNICETCDQTLFDKSRGPENFPLCHACTVKLKAELAEAKRQLAEAGRAWHTKDETDPSNCRSGWFLVGMRGKAISELNNLPKPEGGGT